MELLERERYLKELENSFRNVTEDNGSVIIISGEAGIGKTSLVDAFIEKLKDKANILWGACDALFTPRPLGPLYDIAAQLKNGLLNLLNNQAERATIFTKFLQNLQESKLPNVLIIEDVHWADESTLDLIKFLCRRTNRINSLFIITYRDDEIGPEHPLRFVLGDISSRNLDKFKLTALSERTVNELANSHGIKNLFQITGGNPFLITELLSNKDEEVPSTIKDSILTRISRLSSEAREFVELVSIIPTRSERWLINEVNPIKSEIPDECFNSGILRFENDTISFKHELSRMAVEDSLTESK
ncbi:MAG: AAA family ATPase, partial [Ignavibacteriaceae bacterium]